MIADFAKNFLAYLPPIDEPSSTDKPTKKSNPSKSLTASKKTSKVTSISKQAATKEPAMEAVSSVRYIVQVNVEGKGWTAYVAYGSRKSGRYTLTPQEAFAYLWTLKDGVFRVVKSVVEDGLINQSVVEYEKI